MEIIIFITLFLLYILPFYYFDYRRNKKHTQEGFKTVIQIGLVFGGTIFIIFATDKIDSWIFPVKTNYGFEHNPTRIQKNIPIIEEGWSFQPHMSGQYRQWYAAKNYENKKGHTKKRIEYNWRGAIYEMDYYESPKFEDFLIFKYDYRADSITYHLVRPQADAEWMAEIIAARGKTITDRKPKEIALTESQFEEMLSKWGF